MDPRHPELAVSRLRELMEQYEFVERSMNEAMTSAELASLEREGSLVVQEICLVAPRVHEAMMQTSRNRRSALAHGETETVEKYVEPNQAETIIVEPKPRKKKSKKANK